MVLCLSSADSQHAPTMEPSHKQYHLLRLQRGEEAGPYLLLAMSLSYRSATSRDRVDLVPMFADGTGEESENVLTPCLCAGVHCTL